MNNTNTDTKSTLAGAIDLFKQAIAALERLAAVPAAPAAVMPARSANGRFLPKGDAVTTVKKAKPAKPAKEPRIKIPDHVDDFVKFFFTTPQDKLPSCKCGRYEIVKGDDNRADILYFHSQCKDSATVNANNVIGIRPPKSELGVFNAARIRYGNSSSEQLRPQIAAEAAGAVPVPFENVVSTTNGAGLDLALLQIVEWKKAENLIIPPVSRNRQWTGKFFVTERHFAGALLLKIEDKYFLFDTDREELNHAGFNPFFTQLPGAAATVEEAYALLMPEEVKQALADGKAVKRQGEFFFIPQSHAEIVEAMATHIKDRSLSRVMRQVTDDFDEVGGAHYLWTAVARAEEVERFIERCKKYNGGMLPTGPATTGDAHAVTADIGIYSTTESDIGTAFSRLKKGAIDAELALRPLVNRYLDFSELSDEAMTDDDGDDAYAKYLEDLAKAEAIREENRKSGKSKSVPWVQPAKQRCAHATDTHKSRLAWELSNDCRTWGRGGGALEMRGHIAVKYGVCYELRIGARSDTRTQNAHVATGTLLVPPQVAAGQAQDIYAIGTVTHSGREHRPLYLRGWHKVVSNTATANWTVRP